MTNARDGMSPVFGDLKQTPDNYSRSNIVTREGENRDVVLLPEASRYIGNVLRGKPVAVIGASTGLFGAVWAQAELRKSLGVIGADVLDNELPVGQAHAAFADDGQLADSDLQAALAELIAVLHARATAVGTPAA